MKYNYGVCYVTQYAFNVKTITCIPWTRSSTLYRMIERGQYCKSAGENTVAILTDHTLSKTSCSSTGCVKIQRYVHAKCQ